MDDSWCVTLNGSVDVIASVEGDSVVVTGHLFSQSIAGILISHVWLTGLNTVY